MFEEPDERPGEHAADPAHRAKEKAEELGMYAEIAAVFEGTRKFDAQLQPGMNYEFARDLQRSIARLEKSKTPGTPVLPQSSSADATALLGFARSRELATN